MRPDDESLILWSKGKCLAWDITVPDTYADSHLTATSYAVGSEASEAAIHKMAKYISIACTHNLVPMAIETSGVFANGAKEFLEQVGHRCIERTGDPNEASYLFQQISVAI